ncbi:uncharacterized protein PGRI_016300 [Penicillium griseofulvum]|uniref:Secreted protein CSS2 C-terminal domain-containing protein n=1 Tax=Penicillium patulum TaxID=5078 RepID=A0A135LFS9_PENPA|nr:uncharacterized protein PGRI_016300 [Penicillium griseofulvum]KXG47760.1 hypothetical protein PGRI_016300 [Penicillium griseofulvum]
MLLSNVVIAACCLSTPTLASIWPSSIAALPEDLAETPTAVTGYVSQWVKSLKSTIQTLYNPETCSLMSGTYENMKWSWQSVNPECDIKAQRDAISHATKDYTTSEDNKEYCRDGDTKCLRMVAGSSRDGWLKLKPVDEFDEKAYCGPTLTFDSYLMGGNDRCEHHVL